MPRLLFIVMLCVTILPAPCQTASSNYQVGTIVAVVPHPGAPSDADSSVARYDVSIKVRDTIYVVLYIPPDSVHAVKYAAGSEVLVSIGKDTVTISRKLDGTTEAPILRTETLPAQPAIDWSRAPGQYFSMKMQNLTERLNLSEEQQAKIKPIAEQERGEVGGVCFTPTIPRKERLKRFETIVRASDAKMRPILSQSQWETLLELRKEQKQELKTLIAEKN
jgi:hypothetical protein